ncbi:hypothetical protein Purlil1_8535 [Purpureocillium lilacinum]|uniref:Uncharacterized protein n=1 Tax=Purpureocillium lilacinum TaxID=33203 RepID=A0ABR0BTR5_PURLI|nr:hypothetical protein Purlil1_8535 [Purpureocillium lilacinum]
MADRQCIIAMPRPAACKARAASRAAPKTGNSSRRARQRAEWTQMPDKPDPRAPSLLPPSPERPPPPLPRRPCAVETPGWGPSGTPRPVKQWRDGTRPLRLAGQASTTAQRPSFHGTEVTFQLLSALPPAEPHFLRLPSPSCCALPITRLQMRIARLPNNSFPAAFLFASELYPVAPLAPDQQGTGHQAHHHHPCEQRTTLPAPPIRTLPPPPADHVHFDVCLPPSLSLSTTPSPDAKDKGHETADGFPRRRSGLTARRPSRWRTTDPTTRTLSPGTPSPAPRRLSLGFWPSTVTDCWPLKQIRGARAQTRRRPSAERILRPAAVVVAIRLQAAAAGSPRPVQAAPLRPRVAAAAAAAATSPAAAASQPGTAPAHQQSPPPAAAAAAAGSAAAIASPGLPPAAFACPRRGLRLRLDAAAALPCRGQGW